MAIRSRGISSLQRSGRIYHDPESIQAQKVVKIKNPIKPEEFGHIVSEVVERIIDGVKEYFYSAIDAKGKFALTLNYKRLRPYKSL